MSIEETLAAEAAHAEANRDATPGPGVRAQRRSAPAIPRCCPCVIRRSSTTNSPSEPSELAFPPRHSHARSSSSPLVTRTAIGLPRNWKKFCAARSRPTCSRADKPPARQWLVRFVD